MDQGWNPDWDGPEDQKRSAREYIDRGVLLSTAKAQSNEIKELRAAVGQLSDHNKKVYESGYLNAIKDLNAQKAKAITDSDGDRVIELDNAIEQTRYALQTVRNTGPIVKPTTVVGETSSFSDFKKENSWYNNDADMRDWAHGVALSYAKRNMTVSK